MKPIDVSIVILNTNDRHYLAECLESLRRCTETYTLEVIVVDNASTDGSIEMVGTKFPEVKLIKNAENLGFTKGNNVGIRASRGRYVFLLNSDIRVLPGCIDTLVRYLDENPRVGILGPKILNPDLTHQSSCRNFPSIWNNFCSAAGLARVFKGSRFFSGEHMLYFRGDRVLDVDVLVGCFSAVRRTAMNEFGLLDEGLYMYGDDVDWCRRCWNTGWRVTFFPGAHAVHYRATSTKKDPVRYAVMQQRSVLYYWNKYHGAAGRFGISCVIFAHLSIRLGAGLLKGLLIPPKQGENQARIRMSLACLGALCFGRWDDRSGKPEGAAWEPAASNRPPLKTEAHVAGSSMKA
jgi:GT2 family glycosyltransferase